MDPQQALKLLASTHFTSINLTHVNNMNYRSLDTHFQFPVFIQMDDVITDMTKHCFDIDGETNIEKMVHFIMDHNGARKLDAARTTYR